MAQYRTLHELLQKDPRSKELYEGLSPDAQMALQELRQDIRTYEELRQFAAQKRS